MHTPTNPLSSTLTHTTTRPFPPPLRIHSPQVGYRSSKKQTSQKSGYSDMLVNRNLVKMIALLLPICLAGATAHAVLRAGLDSDDEPWYLPSEARYEGGYLAALGAESIYRCFCCRRCHWCWC
eukprot:6195147-Pleurochrysis_carterae.AAC.2